MKNIIFLSLILFALSLLIVLPHLYGLSRYTKNYSPLIRSPDLPIISEETYTYAPEVFHLLKGYWRGDPYLFEHRAEPSPYVTELASIIPISFLSAISGSVDRGFILSDVIFPILLFLTLYLFLKNLKYSPYTATAVSLGVVVVPFFSTLFPFFKSYGTFLTGSLSGSLFMSRTPHPQISTIFLFLALFTTVFMLNSKNKKLLYIWSIIVGFSFYSSFFVASTVALASVFITPSLVKKYLLKDLITGLLIFVLVIFPFLINYFQGQHMFTDHEFLKRLSLENNFLFPTQIRYLIFGFIFFMIKKIEFSKVVLFYIIAASLLTDFHQIIFKINIQSDHWIFRILAPIGTLSLLLIIDQLLLKSKKNIWVFVSLIIILIGFSKQVFWLNSHGDELKANQEHRNIITQIKNETDLNNVIGTLTNDLNDEIAGSSGRWVYVASGDRSWIKSAESMQRICNMILLSPQKTQETEIRAAISYSLGLESRYLEKVNQKLSQVEECVKNNSLKNDFKLDYIVAKTIDGQFKLIKNVETK